MLKQFNQLKISNAGSRKIFSLFDLFRLRTLLKRSGMTKSKGHQIHEMFFYFLTMILENRSSLYSGLMYSNILRMKTPINDILNNPNYNWRKLLYSISKIYIKLIGKVNFDKTCLIFDDTVKEKTGHKTHNISWFRDHSKDRYFKGYQNITAVWSDFRIAIPFDFELKIGKRRTKHSRRAGYHKGTHTNQRISFAKQKKTDIVIQMLRRAIQRNFAFKYVLWDSWYNCSKSLSYVFEKLEPKGKVLISMLKRGNTKYRFNSKFLDLKALYKSSGKWKKDRQSGVKYKSIIVEVLDTESSKIICNRNTIGSIKICFYKYPKIKKWKSILSTDLNINELEVLRVYLQRWSIECVFKEIKQYFGYNQSKSSNYAAMISDLSIRYIFYIMFCYRKTENKGSMGQQVFDFYNEMHEMWLCEFINMMFIRLVKNFIDLAIEFGFSDLENLRNNLDSVLAKFFEKDHFIDKIEEVDNRDFSKIA